MRRAWGWALGLAVWLLALEASAFCGFYVSGADAKLYNNATQVVLLRDGIRTVLSMANDYQGPPQDFAMVVPVPVVLQKENVKTLPAGVFERLDRLTAPRLVQYWEQDPCDHPSGSFDRARSMAAGVPAPAATGMAAGGAPLVRVEAEFTVGEYEVVILSAQDSTALDAWLHQNGYRIPEGAEPVLRPYVARGAKFFVAKVNPRKVRFENGRATLSPLRFHYDDDTFQLPVRLGLLNSRGVQDLIVHVLGRGQRYEVANYPNLTIPTNIEITEQAAGAFGAFYVQLFDKTVAARPGAVVTEYAWSTSSCDPCPGPPLDPSDVATLGGDQVGASAPGRGGDTSWVVTRLHARYTRDTLGEDLVFRAAPPIQGGNGWQQGDAKHRASPATWGGSQFQGRYILRHYWDGPITCTDPEYGRWGGQPRLEVGMGLAFAPRDGAPLPKLVAEDVPSLGLVSTAPPVRRRVSLLAYFRGGTGAVALGLFAGTLVLWALVRRARRPA
jgi:hypothetical protein